MRAARVYAAGLLGLFLLTQPCRAAKAPAPPAAAPSARTLTTGVPLANGIFLTVCDAPYLTAGKTAFKVAFDVTWRDEPAGEEGVRLMALGSVVQLDPGHRKLVEKAGGWWDPTNIYPEVAAQDFVLPAGREDLGIRIVTEMLAGIQTDEARLERFFEAFRPAALKFASPGPKRDILAREAFAEPFSAGSLVPVKEAVKALSFERFLAFRRGHFTPQRAAVTVVGAFGGDDDVKTRLEKALAGIPAGPARAPKAARLETVRCGRHVAVRSDAKAIWIGYPVPFGIPHVETEMVARLVEARLKAEGWKQAACQADRVSGGVRLFRITLPGGGGEGKLKKIDACLGDFSWIAPEPVRKLAALQAGQATRAGHLANPYWLGWSIAFHAEPLGWSASTPWLEMDRLRTMEADTVRLAARMILDARNRVVVEGRGPGADEEIEVIVESTRAWKPGPEPSRRGALSPEQVTWEALRKRLWPDQ